MFFSSSGLLWGLLLASVPIIIHLLSRRRFTRVQWAPMHYLKLTIRKNRKRLRVEQWLLLLIRTLFIIFLICAVARPILSSQNLFGWLAGKGHTARILVIDDSLSMGYALDGRSAFERARELAEQIVKNQSKSDSLTLVTCTNANQPVFREVNTDEPGELFEAIRNLQLTQAPSRWSTCFASLTELLGGLTYTDKEVVVITDLRRNGWDREVTETLAEWDPKKVSLNIIDLGRREAANVALVSLELMDSVVLVDAPLTVRAVVRNDEENPVSGVQATLLFGDKARPVVLPELLPGQETEIVLKGRFDAVGHYPISFRLPEDPLSGDNLRWIMADVRKELRIRLVDGEPGLQPFTSEIDFLSLAFSIGNVAWHVDRMVDTDWFADVPSAESPQPDLLVLANVASIPPEKIERLEAAVRKGMGLMIFPGGQIDVQSYNLDLFRDAQGLLPAAIDRIYDEKATGLLVEDLSDSPLSSMRALAPASLARIEAKQHLGFVTDESKEDVRILARWNDGETSPLVVEKPFGRGKVLLWSVSADRDWSDWPIDPTFVLCMREAAGQLVRSQLNQRNFSAGEDIHFDLGDEVAPEDPMMAEPGTERPVPVVVQESVLHFPQARKAGLYRMSWDNPQGIARAETFAVNPDAGESDLVRVSDQDLTTLAGTIVPNIVHHEAGEINLSNRGAEFWRTLLIGVLILLGAESILACYIGRRQ